MNGFSADWLVLGYLALGFAVTLCGLRLYIIPRERGRRGEFGERSPCVGDGGIVGHLSVQAGQEEPGGHAKNSRRKHNSAVAQAIPLPGEIDILTRQGEGLGGAGITARGYVQGVEGVGECGNGRHGVGGDVEGRLQVVDVGCGRVKRRPICYARSVRKVRFDREYFTISLAAVRAVLVAVDWARDVEATQAMPASVTGRAWVRVFGHWGVAEFVRTMDAPDLLCAGASRATPAGIVPVVARRGVAK